MLIVVSGLPCVGKSAIADALGRGLAAPVVSVDEVLAAIWRSGAERSTASVVASYEAAAAVAAHHLRLGLTVIVDAVCPTDESRGLWRTTATRVGADLRVIEVICTDEHLHRQRLERRSRETDGLPEPSWGLVEALRRDWQHWPDTHVVLDTIRPLEELVADARSSLRGPAGVRGADGRRGRGRGAR